MRLVLTASLRLTLLGLVFCAAPAAAFNPQPCDGSEYTDVPQASDFCPWIRQLKLDEITEGCAAGRYCPDGPVTRQQLAVMLERLARGTDTFKLQQRYAKVATVALLGTGDYDNPDKAIDDLVAWCGSPGVNNRCLVRVEPGIYTLPSTLVLPDYVDLEGAGLEMTRLDFAGTDDANAPAILPVGEGEVRDLEIRASGGDYPLCLFLKEGSFRTIRRVRALALSGGVASIAVRVTNGASPEILDSELGASGGVGATALDVSGGAFASIPIVRRTKISAGGTGATCVGVAVLGNVSTAHIAIMYDVEIHVLSCASGIGVSAGDKSIFSLRGGSISALFSTVENVGLKTAPIWDTHVLDNVELSASGSGNGIGIVLGGGPGSVEIRDSQIAGVNFALSATGGGAYAYHSQFFGPLTATASTVVNIATSQLNSTVGGGGTFKCVGAFDENFDPLGVNCL
jgi:hypothetical protein